MAKVAKAMLLQFVILGLGQVVLSKVMFGGEPVLTYLANGLVLVVALVVSMSIFGRTKVAFAGLTGKTIGFSLAWGVILAFLMNWMSAILAQYFSKIYNPQVISQLLTEQQGSLLVVLLIFTCIIGPLAEELFFRGFVQAELQSTYGTTWAVLLSGVLFGAYHFDLVRWLPLTVAGIILGYVKHKSVTIWAPVLAHVVWNSMTALLLLM